MFRWYLAYPLAVQSIALLIIIAGLVKSGKLKVFFEYKYTLNTIVLAALVSHLTIYYWASHMDTIYRLCRVYYICGLGIKVSRKEAQKN